jgi:PAS domain S-box-containing protein
LSIGNDITRSKETERALIESEKKFRTIVETASEGIIIGTLDGRFSYLNAKMCDMLGYSSEEILGRKGLKFISAGQKDKVFKTRDILKHSSLSEEFKFVRKDGTILWTSCNASPIYDKNGIHIANLAMHTDITQRKRTEEELFRSNERFKTAFDEGAIAMAITSLNGELLKVNRAFCELTGYSEQDLSGIGFQKLTYPDDLATNLTGFNEILTGGKSSFRMEKRYIRKDGEIIWVDISTAPVRDQFGNIEYMVTHIQDINERKKSENELRYSREKLDIALESGHIGIWERDLRSDKMVWDKRMENIFNLEHGTFRGDYSAFEELINEEDLPHYRKALRIALEYGSLFETIFRTNHRTGISKHISTKAIVNKDDKGTPISLSGICFDVTGMKEGAEKDILKLNEELLRSNRELESFAYVASHDLQEPLRMVASFTQMLSQRYGDKLDENAREYIKYAVDGSKRMYDLINGLLAYSRIQTKGKEFSDVDMASVFDKVTYNLGLVLEDKKVKIRKNELPVVFADESQMIQLVQNLFENALKFNKSKPVIDFSSTDKGDCYEFSVRDNGIGIESQYFERIFKIFQQLMPKDEYEGTGIGLAICRRITERHNGKIWVESVPGKGSSFFFTIPKK